MAERAACNWSGCWVRRPAACRGPALILFLSVLFWPPLARRYSPAGRAEGRRPGHPSARPADRAAARARSRPLQLPLPPEVLWLVVAVALGVLLYAFRDLCPFRRREHGGWSADGGRGGRRTGIVRCRMRSLGRRRRARRARAGSSKPCTCCCCRGLADIRRGSTSNSPIRSTSREILRERAAAGGRAARSLRDIVDRVEWTYFGEHPAALADYAGLPRELRRAGAGAAGKDGAQCAR